MNPPEDSMCVFIVRLWLEAREIPDADPEWRGTVEHVPSGHRVYVKCLDEITGFISRCASGMPQHAPAPSE